MGKTREGEGKKRGTKGERDAVGKQEQEEEKPLMADQSTPQAS
jgi:hypothetical protein